jgi:uncharacterized protein YqhQ
VSSERIRLGGMALANGVLVHGPYHWACAVRTDDGQIKIASGEKPLRVAETDSRFLRGPLRMAQLFALLPIVRRRLPEARLPFEKPGVAATLLGSAAAVRALRSSKLSPLAQELLAGVLAVAPAAAALRGSALAEYHGAEHISIGTYEHGEERQREHERCGSHMLGPLLLTNAAASMVAGRAPAEMRPLARLAGSVGALAASVEIFSWMVQNERHPLARALSKPGHELQHRFVTADPSPEQLEVANAALAECLRLEQEDDGGRRDAPGEATPT